MNYNIGRYYKIQDSLWSRDEAFFINITNVDYDKKLVYYHYDDESKLERVRSFEDFSRITLVPTSPLLEALI